MSEFDLEPGPNVLEQAVSIGVGFVQQYGFLLLFLGIVAYFAMDKLEERKSEQAVRKLNDPDRQARMRAEVLRVREQQQQKVKGMVKQSLEAEKERKKAERETRRKALEAVENYDPTKHNGFDVKKNPLMSGGHGKTFTNRPRFGRPKPPGGGG